MLICSDTLRLAYLGAAVVNRRLVSITVLLCGLEADHTLSPRQTGRLG